MGSEVRNILYFNRFFSHFDRLRSIVLLEIEVSHERLVSSEFINMMCLKWSGMRIFESY